MCLLSGIVSSVKGAVVMKRDVCLFERIVGVGLMLILSAGIIPTALAQEKNQDKSQSKARNERKKKEELKSVYKNWLDQDVSYIITDEERKAFKALKTDEERDQ